MTNTKKKTKKKQEQLFAGMKVTDNGKRRALTQRERDELIAMLSFKERPEALTIDPLVPQGSFIARLLRLFEQTDASYALPLWQLIMIAASYLTQGGATLFIPGLKPHRPVLWTIALAPSGSSKTLATDMVASILNAGTGADGIQMFPTGATDAQWIIDLGNNNGSYWFQDEVGQFIQNVLKSGSYTRIKPWMLDAYSNKPISNRLKGEANKLTIDDPHFTFFGLSVRETWSANVDAASMLDGFCQRFNFVIAPERTDTDIFEHFLFFQGEKMEAKQRELQTTWATLCQQPMALEQYRLQEDVIPYLQNWFRGLRESWGSGALPGSFIRRTGFSILSYLVVIHFLLGRSNTPIDVETAEIATRYAEFHMESALIMSREYGARNASHIQKISDIRESLLANGTQTVTARDIQQRLSTNQRKEISAEKTKQVLEVLNRLEVISDLFEGVANTPKEKSAVLQERHKEIRAKEQETEKWRNEKRLQVVKKLSAEVSKRNGSPTAHISEPEFDGVPSCVIEFGSKLTKSG